MTRAPVFPWGATMSPAPSVNARVGELERLTREARDLAAGARTNSETGRLAVSRAAAALQEAQAALAEVEALRARTIAAGNLAARLLRQAEESPA